MRRFISKILLISTFFIGLGAIGDTVQKALIPNELECEMKRVSIVKIENESAGNVNFQLILPNFENPNAEKSVLILRQSEIVE